MSSKLGGYNTMTEISVNCRNSRFVTGFGLLVAVFPWSEVAFRPVGLQHWHTNIDNALESSLCPDRFSSKFE